jgi:hypothetical protein
MHWGFGEGFGSFASSPVVLIGVPWSCAIAAAVLTGLPRYAQRPNPRLFVRLLLVISVGCLLLALVFVVLGSPPLSGPE